MGAIIFLVDRSDAFDNVLVWLSWTVSVGLGPLKHKNILSVSIGAFCYRHLLFMPLPPLPLKMRT